MRSRLNPGHPGTIEVIEWLRDSPDGDDLVEPSLRSLVGCISPHDSPGELIDRLVESAGRAARCSSGIVWVSRRRGVRPRGWWGPVMALQQHGPAQAAALVVSEQRDVMVRSVEWNPDISSTDSHETLSIPIPPLAPVAGALTLTRPTTPDGFTRSERTIALMAASLIGVAMDRSIHDQELHPEKSFHAQRLEVLGRLAAGTAHDLNNLLMAIDGYAQMLADDPRLEEDATGDIREIRRATAHSIELVRAVLGFSRSEAGVTETIETNSLIGGIRRLLDQVAGKRVTVTLNLSSQQLRTRIDSVQLEQVVVNLVANARDASRIGGQVEIETSRAPSGAGPVKATEGFVRIVVKDSGTGISDDVKERIFDPFFTTKARGSGTGLGLATANEIVRGAGGSLEVESEPGKGTTFIILLPAAP